MNRTARILLVVFLVFAILPVQPARAEAEPSPFSFEAQAVSLCQDGPHPSGTGALFRICMPGVLPWNGSLVVFAHGYVKPGGAPYIPEDQLVLPDGTSIPGIVNSLGFAFATTSYRNNGLAVRHGVDDLVELVEIFRSAGFNPRHVYLVGASEGGLITTLAVEQRSDVFTGGLATCGPTGDFRKQVDYWGDFRTVFDYFFPGVLPPDAINVPQALIDNWETLYAPAVALAINSQPLKTAQLLKVTRAPFNPFDRTTILQTVLGIAWYNVFATNDGKAWLGGNPYDNSNRRYIGSFNDTLLNLGVTRYVAEPQALAEIQAYYQTSGQLPASLVNMHTTGDPIVPYWHAALYKAKVYAAGSQMNYIHIPILRYGHCQFKPAEVLFGFALLVLRSTGETLQGIEASLPNDAERARFQELENSFGVVH